MPNDRDDSRPSNAAQDTRPTQSAQPLKPSSQQGGGPKALRNAKDRAPQPDGAGADVPDDDGHLGATEEQVSETPAPAGDDFEDEPKQG